ncbi:hypothetical protein Pst134EB_014217 [Puccinia striiformis f. sp. tritici]|nr:hypothetical protein Pst134EB_014217 [Puccinia striiformis f. sp. tritici]
MEFWFILPPGLGRSTGGHINQYNIPRGQVPSAVDSAILAAVAVQMANQFSQMHNPASMGGEPVTPVNPNLQPPPAMAASGRGLLTDYLRYVGITNIDATLATLATHKIHHYEMFKPDFLSLEQLEKLRSWGGYTWQAVSPCGSIRAQPSRKRSISRDSS